MNGHGRWCFLCLVVSAAVSWGQPAKVDAPERGVKSRTMFGVREEFGGVVVKVDAKGMTVRGRGVDDTVEVVRTFPPIDLLAAGKVHRTARGAQAYLWGDVKEGDGVFLSVLKDDGDGQTYCVDIGIVRRPGAKLPASSDPQPSPGVRQSSVLNDIENGEDVSDEEVGKAFAPYVSKMSGKLLIPGGLKKDYQAKLDAIRAKKKDDVKAPPPVKK